MLWDMFDHCTRRLEIAGHMALSGHLASAYEYYRCTWATIYAPGAAHSIISGETVRIMASDAGGALTVLLRALAESAIAAGFIALRLGVPRHWGRCMGVYVDMMDKLVEHRHAVPGMIPPAED